MASAETPRRSKDILPVILEESPVKRALFAFLVILGTTSFAQQAVPEIPFDSVPNFFKLPADINFGEAAGVAVNSKGHIFVYTRSNSATGSAYGGAASQILEFDQTGK